MTDKKRPCDYTAEESKAAEPKWAKNLVIFLIAFAGIPLLFYGPLVLLEMKTGILGELFPTSNRDSDCTPSLFGECD